MEGKSAAAGVDLGGRRSIKQTEMRELLVQEEESKKEMEELFEKLGYNIK